ncbi:HD-GYP domain-containing protein [Sulfurimonas sp. HSL3-2]|uniref:HD-GYP domain-containing protein n=1 Tax=Hydrocurvibacter mobilis TaxID=3131936 RepID=UPI0031F8233C
MAAARYIPIDKSIIQEGMVFGFDLFFPSESKTEMHCFKENGIPVSCDERSMLDTLNTIYINETEYADYEQFCKDVIDSSQEVDAINSPNDTALLYKNASEVLNSLFNNPETLGNYEACKEVVSDLVDTILVDNFTLKSLLVIASHDYYTHTHSINVAIYALSLGSFLGLQQETLAELGEAALLHDLGKSKIDPAIINKNGKLTDKEFQEVQKHSDLGYTVGLKLGIKNKNVLQGIRHHHEKMDGTGYPLKLKGKDIPLFARIIGACDIFDALTSRRTYKEPMTTFDALKLMKTTMKEHLDVRLLDKMITMFKEP